MNINSEPTSGSRRILLVAANPTFRSWGATVLREAGCWTDGEATAERGWKALRSRGYELIIIDYKLPDTSGLRFILKMRRDHLIVPAVLITEYPPLLDPSAHRRLRSTAVVLRPVTAEEWVDLSAMATREKQPRPLALYRQPLISAAPLSPPSPGRYLAPKAAERSFVDAYSHYNYGDEGVSAATRI